MRCDALPFVMLPTHENEKESKKGRVPSGGGEKVSRSHAGKFRARNECKCMGMAWHGIKIRKFIL